MPTRDANTSNTRRHGDLCHIDQPPAHVCVWEATIIFNSNMINIWVLLQTWCLSISHAFCNWLGTRVCLTSSHSLCCSLSLFVAAHVLYMFWHSLNRSFHSCVERFWVGTRGNGHAQTQMLHGQVGSWRLNSKQGIANNQQQQQKQAMAAAATTTT